MTRILSESAMNDRPLMGLPGRAPAPPTSDTCAGTKDKKRAMTEALKNSIAFVGIDIGKNSFHVVGLDECGSCCGRSGRVARWKHGSPRNAGTRRRNAVLSASRKGRTFYQNLLAQWPSLRRKSCAGGGWKLRNHYARPHGFRRAQPWRHPMRVCSFGPF